MFDRSIAIDRLGKVSEYFANGWGVEVSDRMRAEEYLEGIRAIPGLLGRITRLMESFGPGERKAITLSGVVHRDNFRDLGALAERARAWGVKMNFSTYTWLRTN